MTTPRFELTSQRQKVSRLPTEPPGRSAVVDEEGCYFMRRVPWVVLTSPVFLLQCSAVDDTFYKPSLQAS